MRKIGQFLTDEKKKTKKSFQIPVWRKKKLCRNMIGQNYRKNDKKKKSDYNKSDCIQCRMGRFFYKGSSIP